MRTIHHGRVGRDQPPSGVLLKGMYGLQSGLNDDKDMMKEIKLVPASGWYLADCLPRLAG